MQIPLWKQWETVYIMSRHCTVKYLRDRVWNNWDMRAVPIEGACQLLSMSSSLPNNKKWLKNEIENALKMSTANDPTCMLVAYLSNIKDGCMSLHCAEKFVLLVPCMLPTNSMKLDRSSRFLMVASIATAPERRERQWVLWRNAKLVVLTLVMALHLFKKESSWVFWLPI